MRNDTLKILWNVNLHLLLCGFMNVHVADPHTIINILDICLELKVHFSYIYFIFRFLFESSYIIFQLRGCPLGL